MSNEMTYGEIVLRRMPIGTRIYGMTRRRTQSGSRVIEVYVADNGQIVWLTPAVHKLCGHRYSKARDGVVFTGVGLSAIEDIVRGLGSEIHGDAYYFSSEVL
jgi:hypothetical protein